jgi:MAF protein
MRFVLASASPRRRELLALLGLPFDVRPTDIDEDPGRTRDPQIAARRLARIKAEAARLTEPDAPIVAADTIVSYELTLLGKPRDAAEARDMLQMLRGQTHVVVTAVALMPPGRRSILGRQPLTRVTMRGYTDGEIEAWIASGGPFDRAGAYAIQDDRFRPVERYDGCYCNVVGLPLWPLLEMLRKAELSAEVTPAQLLPQCASCPFAASSKLVQ